MGGQPDPAKLQEVRGEKSEIQDQEDLWALSSLACPVGLPFPRKGSRGVGREISTGLVLSTGYLRRTYPSVAPHCRGRLKQRHALPDSAATTAYSGIVL